MLRLCPLQDLLFLQPLLTEGLHPRSPLPGSLTGNLIRTSSQGLRGNVHVRQPQLSQLHRWECILCVGRRSTHSISAPSGQHSHHATQRMGHIQSKNSVLQLPGRRTFNTAACKSTLPVSETVQSTSPHNDFYPPDSNSLCSSQFIYSPGPLRMPDALMTTAQVLLIGPRGQDNQGPSLDRLWGRTVSCL